MIVTVSVPMTVATEPSEKPYRDAFRSGDHEESIGQVSSQDSVVVEL